MKYAQSEISVTGVSARDEASHRGTARNVLFRYFDPKSAKVHLWMNRVTDKQHASKGWMHRTAAEGWWEVELALDSQLRAAYGFTPLQDDEDLPQGPPPEIGFRTRLDPLNPRSPLRSDGNGGGLSIYVGDAAPAQEFWEHPDPAAPKGAVRVIDRPLDAASTVPALGEPRLHYVYTPAGTHQKPLPLLVIFDGEDWFGDLNLPTALDAAIAAGALPPMVVLGIGNTSRANRMATLGVREDVFTALIEHTMPWFTQWLTEQGLTPVAAGQWIIAGQSLGGIAALGLANTHPDVFGFAAVSSPSVWWSPVPGANPGFLANPEHGSAWVREYFGNQPVSNARINVSIGTGEDALVEHTARVVADFEIRGADLMLRTYAGGHDAACWRGELLDDLTEFTAIHQIKGNAS